MRAAGIQRIDSAVEVLELPEPRALAADEVLIEVAAAGVGNWDEIVRTGGWDVGSTPPMALGVEAAGTVVAVGADVTDVVVGAEVLTHPLPLREQGTWAERLIAPANLVGSKPAGVSWEAAAAFVVPALTAEQVLSEALSVQSGQTLLVHGASGITGGMLVELAVLRGLRVIATAGPAAHDRVRALGAAEVLDYHDDDWPSQVLRFSGGGVDLVANAARGGAATALSAVVDGGRLATITSDTPAAERGITMSEVYVRPDGDQLTGLAALLGEGQLTVTVAGRCSFADAGEALAKVVKGTSGGAVVLTPM
ncbi:NADP-dependent oxidoreductase [Actinocrispum sp. NPDC049592]|uniref:NADP-dependent oxidoreductase n=1 Tax=Actinocrispum sp. NPDC049592 TaxID=3154835 RepID=UPI00342129A3